MCIMHSYPLVKGVIANNVDMEWQFEEQQGI